MLAFWDIFFTLCMLKACVNLYFFTSTCLTIFRTEESLKLHQKVNPSNLNVSRQSICCSILFKGKFRLTVHNVSWQSICYSFLKVNLGWRCINMIVDAIACLWVQLWSLYSVSGKFLHLPWMWFSLFFAVMYFVVVLVFCGWEVKWGVFFVLFCVFLPFLIFVWWNSYNSMKKSQMILCLFRQLQMFKFCWWWSGLVAAVAILLAHKHLKFPSSFLTLCMLVLKTQLTA